MCHAVYFALTLMVEAGIIQSTVHRARHALKHKKGYSWLGRHIFSAVPTESSTNRDVEDVEQPWEGEGEDEDVKEERLTVASGAPAFHAYRRTWVLAQLY